MDSSSATTATLASLNAEAIGLLKAGNPRMSISLLQQGLTKVRSTLHQGGNEDTVRGHHCNPASLTGRICIPVGNMDDVILLGITAGSSESFLQEGDGVVVSDRAGPLFCLFDRAFSLRSSSCDDDDDATSRASSVILYNLALSHVMLWRESHENADLLMAIKLFKMALSVVESCLANSSKALPNNEFVLLQLLAIFNNLGYLQYYYRSSSSHGEYSAVAKHCVGAIRALLTSTRTSATNTPASTEQQTNNPNYQDFLFFRWSSMFLFERKEPAIAPAA